MFDEIDAPVDELIYVNSMPAEILDEFRYC